MKIHRTYTVEEAAAALDVHKNTVREWIRTGLPVLNDKRPLLIRGEELSTFLRVRGTSKKRKCQVWEVYCMRCRAPKAPAGEMGECVPTSGKRGMLKAICPDCNSMMNRCVNRAVMKEIVLRIDVTFPLGWDQVSDTTTPNVNSDFKSGDQA